MEKQVQNFGIAWYIKADYEKLKTIQDDGALMPATFEQWENMANDGRNKLIRDGRIVVKAYIDAEIFPAWCLNRGMKIDANARMAFAAIESSRVAKKMDQG